MRDALIYGLKKDGAWVSRLTRGVLLGAGLGALPLVNQIVAGGAVTPAQWKAGIGGGALGMVIGWLRGGEPNQS